MRAKPRLCGGSGQDMPAPQKMASAGYRIEAMRLVGTMYRQEKLAIPAVTSSQFVDRDTRYDGLGDIA